MAALLSLLTLSLLRGLTVRLWLAVLLVLLALLLVVLTLLLPSLRCRVINWDALLLAAKPFAVTCQRFTLLFLRHIIEVVERRADAGAAPLGDFHAALVDLGGQETDAV